MKNTTIKHMLLATSALAFLALIGQWAWNSTGGLIGEAQIEYRQALAVLVLLFLLRIVLVPSRRRARNRRSQHINRTPCA